MNRLTLTVPYRTNDNKAIPHVHDAVKKFFIDTYGGYSAVSVHGNWQDPETGVCYPEDSLRYEALVEEGIDSLYPIAKVVKKEAEQKCVLITCEEVHIECQ